ncbi:MAG: AarF/ABC1/UbiB kinase family protein [Flavobacterium sp.]|nr:AarF/ABC1/UbiB kinase family protein [Pedobacter sp.]
MINDTEKSSLLKAAPRLIQIMRVLARHKFLRSLLGKKNLPPPKEVREAFEELGLVFLKFGQVLAMRRDLLPADYIKELELLHDDLPAMDISIVRSTVKAELGTPLSKLFLSFTEKPIAAATIAQVHEATIRDRRQVAVKVQRPGLKEIISKDIAALTYLVSLGEKFFPKLRVFDLPVIVREFAITLNRETDFSREARSMLLFRKALANIPDLWIPDVVKEYSGKTVLTMDFSAGERIDYYAKKHPEAMPQLMNILIKLTLQSIFEEGSFHADPHPGNVFVLPDGRLSLLDFGNTGELDEAMRESLILLLEAVVKGDAKAATEAYLEMASASEEVNHAALLVDMKAVLYDMHSGDMEAVSIGDAFDSLMSAGTRNGVHNPPEFVLLTRTFVILESLIRQLAPEHNYMKSFSEEIKRLTKKHFSPKQIKEKTIKLARDMERLIMDAPADTRRILRRIAEGNLGRVQAPALEKLAGDLSLNIKQLAGAIALAALVVSGTMLLFSKMGGWHHLLGVSMIIIGISGTIIGRIGTWFRDRGKH